MASKAFTLNFMGDTMLGRLIDQMFPQHVYEPSEAKIAESFLRSRIELAKFEPETPWGDTLALLREADLNILNLETSATTHPTKWPDKVFNYRMHPANIAALQAANISYAGLANNHTLDFCDPGLLETVKTVKQAGIASAGAGEDREEATRPAILHLASKYRDKTHEIHVWAASDHPKDWAKVPTFHFIDYSQQCRSRLKKLITRPSQSKPALRIFSVHWGPNYAWHPAKEIRDLAHFLIDSCGIDIVHGHSSHHIQGVEKYNSKLIIYGCGDFVDDYALVPEYRNDLSGIWRVSVEEEVDGDRVQLKELEIFPTKIDKFVARRLESNEYDFEWVCSRVQELSSELGTEVNMETGDGERMWIDLAS